MIKLKIKDREYKLKFGYKSFKKSGILREVVAMQKKIKKPESDEVLENGEAAAESAEDNIDVLEEVLELNSKLVLAALQKNHEEFRANYDDPNSVNAVVDKVDDLMDDYMDEEESLSIMDLFQKLVDELFNNGFLSKRSEKLDAALESQDATVVPMDHLRKES